MKRIVPLLLGTIVLAAASCTSAEPIAPETPATPQTEAPDTGAINVRAGLNDPENESIVVIAYLPDDITVEPGSTVNWTFTGPEPHTVTYAPDPKDVLSPDDPDAFVPTASSGAFDSASVVNSGQLPADGTGPSEFSLTFPDEGEFSFYCVIHPGMIGNVHVKAGAGEDPATITARGDSELSANLEEGRAAYADFEEVGTEEQANPKGGTDYTVHMGASTQHTDILAFSPEPVKVKANDTVTFVNASQAPHTATFGKPTAEEASAMAATGNSPLTLTDPSAYVDTGLINPAMRGGSILKLPSFTFVVKDRGTFEYVCLLHVSSGMAGSIEVT